MNQLIEIVLNCIVFSCIGDRKLSGAYYSTQQQMEFVKVLVARGANPNLQNKVNKIKILTIKIKLFFNSFDFFILFLLSCFHSFYCTFEWRLCDLFQFSEIYFLTCFLQAGNTPLHTTECSQEFLELLLECGARIDILNAAGESPLDRQLNAGKIYNFDLLLRKTFKSNNFDLSKSKILIENLAKFRTKTGNNVLHLLVESDLIESLQLLLSHPGPFSFIFSIIHFWWCETDFFLNSQKMHQYLTWNKQINLVRHSLTLLCAITHFIRWRIY